MKQPAWDEVTVFFLCLLIYSGQTMLAGWCLRGWWEARKQRRAAKEEESHAREHAGCRREGV